MTNICIYVASQAEQRFRDFLLCCKTVKMSVPVPGARLWTLTKGADSRWFLQTQGASEGRKWEMEKDLLKRAQLWGAMVELQWLLSRSLPSPPEAQREYWCSLIINVSSKSHFSEYRPRSWIPFKFGIQKVGQTAFASGASHTATMATGRRGDQGESWIRTKSRLGGVWETGLPASAISVNVPSRVGPQVCFFPFSMSKVKWISKSEIQQI